jgi:transposase-like protein
MHPKPPYKTDDLHTFCCQNPECPDYGKRNHKNLTVCATYGAHDYRLIRCRTCKSRFSERKGTVLFNCKIDSEKAISILEHLSEGCGLRKTSRLTRISLGSVSRLSKEAGKHAELTHNELVAFSPSYE